MFKTGNNIESTYFTGMTIHSISGGLSKDVIEELSRIIIDQDKGAPCYVYHIVGDKMYKYMPAGGFLRPMYTIGTDSVRDPECIKLTRALTQVKYQEHPYTNTNHETY